MLYAQTAAGYRHGVSQQVSSIIGNRSVCVYIHTSTRTYIYIHIHTNKPWFNSTHSESVSESLQVFPGHLYAW